MVSIRCFLTTSPRGVPHQSDAKRTTSYISAMRIASLHRLSQYSCPLPSPLPNHVHLRVWLPQSFYMLDTLANSVSPSLLPFATYMAWNTPVLICITRNWRHLQIDLHGKPPHRGTLHLMPWAWLSFHLLQRNITLTHRYLWGGELHHQHYLITISLPLCEKRHINKDLTWTASQEFIICFLIWIIICICVNFWWPFQSI